jgi:hypothetical protein
VKLSVKRRVKALFATIRHYLSVLTETLPQLAFTHAVETGMVTGTGKQISLLTRDETVARHAYHDESDIETLLGEGKINTLSRENESRSIALCQTMANSLTTLMNETSWKSFLTEYNRELMSYEEVVERLPSELIKAEWLGYAGATESEIAATEKRLATHLPPSYRSFLKVSNGWRFPSVSIFDLRSVAKLTWFREQNQAWIDAYADPSAELPPISDKEYFVYGEKQDCVNFRREYLQTALQISEVGDVAVVLLNPNVVAADGEWETWFFANWLPGAVRYRSFGDWLTAERVAWHKQIKTLPRARVKKFAAAKKPRTVKKAVEAARGGQTEVALVALEAFAGKGNDSATAPLAEIYAFFGQWDKVIANAGRLIANPESVYVADVFTDMVKVLGLAGHRSGDWEHAIEVVATALQANANRYPGKESETARNYYDKIFLNLVEYAKRQGKPPHELIGIFPVPDHLKYLIKTTNLTQEQREKKYQDAVKTANTSPFLKPHLKTAHAKAEHVFSLIKDVWEDKALELYEEHGANFLMAWEAALYVARVHARRGNPDAAWTVIEANLSKWWPVAIVQVAPIILLTDEHLNVLMTPDRCQLVLSTPRGPEALKNDK